VTHDQQEALSFADHLAVLEDGRVVQAARRANSICSRARRCWRGFLGRRDDHRVHGADRETETPLGRVRVGRATPDGPARIMLRPEQIRLVPWSEGSPTAEISIRPRSRGRSQVVRFAAAGDLHAEGAERRRAIAGTGVIVIIGTGHVIAAP
jgi:iron(III) transport system ATP-binding protein